MSIELSSSSHLEQFLLLAKSARGVAAVELVKQVLEAPNVYVFGELLDMPNIQELLKDPHTTYFNALNLFAYGVYSDYAANKESFPEMSPLMIKKLKHLTVVSLATRNKCIPYKVLLQELDIKNVRELEDLIIDVIYADIVHGKLDQKNQQLEVDYAIGRDIKDTSVNDIVNVLGEWCESCESLLHCIEKQVENASKHREQQEQRKQKIEHEVENLRKTLKATQQQQDIEEHMVTDSREALEKPNKKSSKTKGLRGPKFWGKAS